VRGTTSRGSTTPTSTCAQYDSYPRGALRALSAELRCIVCQNQSIDDFNAGLAKNLGLLAHEQITNGNSDEQMLNYVVARYGEFVLPKHRLSVRTPRLPPFLRTKLTGSCYLAKAANLHSRRDDSSSACGPGPTGSGRSDSN
jgi:cytochrome c-type biogenesis protein CcmH/NrfF